MLSDLVSDACARIHEHPDTYGPLRLQVLPPVGSLPPTIRLDVATSPCGNAAHIACCTFAWHRLLTRAEDLIDILNRVIADLVTHIEARLPDPPDPRFAEIQV